MYVLTELGYVLICQVKEEEKKLVENSTNILSMIVVSLLKN